MDRRQESESDEEKWVYDSSVDHKGRTPLRASTGVWRASLFIIGKAQSLQRDYRYLSHSLNTCKHLIANVYKFLYLDYEKLDSSKVLYL